MPIEGKEDELSWKSNEIITILNNLVEKNVPAENVEILK